MGAYENPPMIQNVTSATGRIWAETAANLGRNIGNAVIARAEQDRKQLEKEDAKAAAIIKSQADWAAKGEAERNRIKDKKEFKSLDKEFQKLYMSNFNDYWKALGNQKNATTEEQLAAATAKVEKYSNFKENAKEDIFGFNDLAKNGTALIHEFTDDKSITAQGSVDTRSPINQKLATAGQILNNMNTYDASYQLVNGSNGRPEMIFDYEINGKKEKLVLNATDLDNYKELRIPQVDKKISAALEKQGVFVDGKISSKYYNEKVDTTARVETKIENGKVLTRTVTTPVISEDNREKLVQAFTTAVQNLGLSEFQKVSAYRNIYSFVAGGESKKFVPEDATYGDGTSAPVLDEKQYNDASALYAGNLAKQKFDEVIAQGTKATSWKQVEPEPGKELTARQIKEKNIVSSLNNLKQGAPPIKLAGKYNVRVADDGTYEVYTIGAQLGNESIVGNYKNTKDLVDLVEGISREKVKKQLIEE